MKVDTKKLSELKNMLTNLERDLADMVYYSTSEAQKVAQNIRCSYNEQRVVAACDEVIRISETIRRSGAKISDMIRAKVKGLNNAIETYEKAEKEEKQQISIFDSIPSPYRSPGTVLGNGIGLYSMYKYSKAYFTDGFNVIRSVANDEVYAIIKGARSESALAEGIAGTRYALKNAERYTKVFKFIDPRVALKNSLSLKSMDGKLGWFGVFLDSVNDLYNNLKKHEKVSKTAGDLTVDVAFGAGGIAASAAAGAVLGSFAPGAGTIIGAGAGLIAGIVYTYVVQVKDVWGSKSIEDISKDKVGQFYEWVF